MSAGLRFLVTLGGYDVANGVARTFYLTNGTGFTTAPDETPASQTFDPTLRQPLAVTRRIHGIAGGRVVPTNGELRVHNLDGLYDAWLGYAFDGRPLTIEQGPMAGAYPDDYATVFTGTVDRVDVLDDELVIRVRDEGAALDAPVQTTLYAGDNVLPDGLEGVEDLEGAPKPLVFGTVRNIPLVPVNSAKLIYQVGDGVVDAVDDVFDAGIRLGRLAPFDFEQTSASAGGYSAASDGTTVVVGYISGGNPAIRTTTDGATYATIGSLPFISSGNVIGMAYDPVADRFCCVTNNATGEIATSDDAGATWTLRTAAAAVQFSRLRHDAERGLWIAVADGGAIHTSPDAETWTARTSGTAQLLNDVAVGGPLLVACGANGAVTTSPDGTTWTATTEGSGGFTRACFDAGIYVMVASGQLYRSPDGLQWTPVLTTAPGYTWGPVAGGAGWLVAVAAGGAKGKYVATSSDRGATWLSAAAPDYSSPAEVLLVGERWFIIDINGTDLSGTPVVYADLTDLEDDALAPLAGSYGWIADSGGTYVRLGSASFGTVTADVSQGATDADRTAGQLVVAVLAKAGYTSGDWSAADITALDAADNSVCGLYLRGGETVGEALDALARTVGAWWGVDASGVIRIQQLTAPSGTATFAVTTHDVKEKLQRVASSDPLKGLPSYRTTLRYARNWTVQGDGVAAGVAAARRADLAREWREVVDTDAAVQAVHLLAQATVEETLFATQADAQAECDRRQALRGTERHAYLATVPLDEFAGVDVGAVGTLTHDRYGLAAGVSVRCLGVQPDAVRRSVTLTLWY